MLGVSIFAVVVLAWSLILSVTNHGFLEETRTAVNTSALVNRLTNEALALAIDVETGGRGFALTRDATFLEPLNRAELKVQSVLVNLSAAVSSDPFQAARVSRLTELTYERLNHSHALVRMIREDALLSAVIDHARKGQILTDSIRELTEFTRQTEEARFQALSETLTEGMHLDENLTIGIGACIVFVVVTLGFVIQRLRRAQAMVKICSWSKTIEYDGCWLSFEDYLQRKFGLQTTHGMSPAEAEKFLGEINRQK